VYELWEAAIEAGGPDDITVALVRLGTQSRGRPRRGGGIPSRLPGAEYRGYRRWSREAR